MIRFLQTPSPAKKIVLGGILLLICGAMVYTMVPGSNLGSSLGLGGFQPGVVATVAGDPVMVNDVQRQARSMLEQQFPQGSAQASMFLPFFAQRAADTLINQRVVLAEAKRLGLSAPPESVLDELQHGRYSTLFFPGGKFVGKGEYESKLQQNGLTVPQFEELVKDEVLYAKLRTLVASGANVTDTDVRQEFDRRNTKVKFDYAVLQKSDLEKALHPSDSELKAFYDRSKASYKDSIPEKRKVRYFLIDSAKVAAETEVTPQEVQSYYDQHRDQYRVSEQVNVRHILIKLPPPGADGKVDAKATEEARKKAEDVLKQLKGGAKFEDLAKKLSDDPGSAKNGGSLGWIEKGRTVPEFEKAAFSLAKGATSDLVQSSYGFHIIRVDDKQDAHMKTLEEVKGEIAPLLKQQKASATIDAQASAVLSQARSAGLEKAASSKGVQVVNTDFFSRQDALPGIGSSPQFMDAVFGASEKAPPDRADLTQGVAIFQVAEIKPPATPSFEEIRARVESEFKNERSAALLSQKTQELSDRAKAAHDLKRAAKELGATIKTSDLVLPDGQVPDLGSMAGPASVAFTLKPGDISGPVVNQNTGSVLLIVEKQAPTDADFAAKKDEIRDSLRENKQQELFGLFVSNVRDQMEKSGKIKINQDEMKNLTRSGNGDQGE